MRHANRYGWSCAGYRLSPRYARWLRCYRAAGASRNEGGRLGFAEWRVAVCKFAQQPRRRPALAILLMPARDLIVHVAHADAVGPIEQAAAIAREAEAVQPHHVYVAGAIGLALFQNA